MTSAGFHGREQELRLLADEANEAAAGRLRVLFIEGEAGIGKTRLMAEAATEAARSGHSVYLGAAEELGARPFGALADAFACTASSDERPEILRLLTEGSGHDPGRRFRIVDAFLDLMEKEAKGRTLLLALDDLQWSDASTLLTIGSALRRLPFAPLLIVGLFRPSPRPPDLDRLLDASTRDGAVQITLGPLGEEEVASLVEDAIGEARDPRLNEMLSGAAGNPLFVTEVLSAFREQGASQVGPERTETRTRALPASLRVTLLRRIGYLPQPTLEVLRIASVLGASFHPSELASVAGRSPIELAPLMDEAGRAGVLIDTGEVLRFRHGLIREAIYQDHAPAVRGSLHAEAAQPTGRGSETGTDEVSALREAELARLAHCNMVEAFALLPPHQPNGVVRRDGAVLLAATRSPMPIFNEVIPIEDEVGVESLAGALQAMRDIGTPWLAHFRSDMGRLAASVSLELGLEEVEVFYPAMVLTDLPRRSHSRSALEVVRFEGPDGYDTYIAHAASISGAHESVWRTWFGSGLLEDPDVAALVGYVDGTPVAKSMSIRTGEVVGIYDVATAETARRRGYGWAITLAAIVAGASSDTTIATLQSSAMGFPVYSAHGFERVFDYRRYREADPRQKQADQR